MLFSLNPPTASWRSYCKREGGEEKQGDLQKLLYHLGWGGGGLDWGGDDGGWQGGVRFGICFEHGIDRTS